MPIYEYRCEECGTVNECLVLGKDEEPKCSSCNSEKLIKLMSAANFATGGNSRSFSPPPDCGGCGSPNSCGNPGSCCSQGN